MTKDKKLISLQKHLEKTKLQLAGSVPVRRIGQMEQYKAYLALEIKRTEIKINDLKA